MNKIEEQITKENDMLRGLLSAAGLKCVHCGLDDMMKCPHGFPGCAQADDMMAARDTEIASLVERLRAKS